MENNISQENNSPENQASEQSNQLQPHKDHQWYILTVMAGQEQKIADDIKSYIKENPEGDISEALVPTKQVLKVKRGKKVQEAQKMFPGYVFLQAKITGAVLDKVKSIPKARTFLGAKNKPQPVAASKMTGIFDLISADSSTSTQEHSFSIGETLSIIDGPFESFSGVVEEFDVEKQRLKISVLIFGRATSVELDVTQVEKTS